MKYVQAVILFTYSLFGAIPAQASVDSYRYLHVSIDTPWAIFIFLFFMVFAPMILAVILYWRYAMQKDDTKDE